jgi:hypothetical protein
MEVRKFSSLILSLGFGKIISSIPNYSKSHICIPDECSLRDEISNLYQNQEFIIVLVHGSTINTYVLDEWLHKWRNLNLQWPLKKPGYLYFSKEVSS